MTTMPITLFLVDDHDVVRRGLRAYVEVLPNMEVVGEASDGEQAIARIDALAASGAAPAVVLMDLVLPGMEASRPPRHCSVVIRGSACSSSPASAASSGSRWPWPPGRSATCSRAQTWTRSPTRS